MKRSRQLARIREESSKMFFCLLFIREYAPTQGALVADNDLKNTSLHIVRTEETHSKS